jgi:Cu-Zn family superoxide dismutase
MGYDPRTRAYFVGAVGGGAVLRGSVDEPEAEIFSAAGADGRTGALAARPDHGRVFVGSLVGKVWIYGEQTGKLLARLDTGLKTSIMNDFAFLPNGTAFVSDSTNPFLWRITAKAGGGFRLEKWLDFTGTPFVYVKGVNADGIVASRDGRYVVLNQLATGKLYRVDVASRQVTEVTKAGGGSFALRNSDGMELVGRQLYVVRNANRQVAKVRLSADFSTGTLVSVTRNPAFAFPTAAIAVGGRLLVLESQLDRLIAKKQPRLPFTITSVRRP